MGRYRHRPLHLFGGVGLLMGAVGFIVLLYLTVLKSGARAIGDATAADARRAARRRRHPVRLARAALRARHVAARGAHRRARAHRADRRGRPALRASSPTGERLAWRRPSSPRRRTSSARPATRPTSTSRGNPVTRAPRRALPPRDRHVASRIAAPESILDVGCGEGVVTERDSRAVTGASTTGVDLGTSDLQGGVAQTPSARRDVPSRRPRTSCPSRTRRSTASARSRCSSTSSDRATRSSRWFARPAGVAARERAARAALAHHATSLARTGRARPRQHARPRQPLVVRGASGGSSPSTARSSTFAGRSRGRSFCSRSRGLSARV